MATHSSILAWRIPQREDPDRLQSMGLHRQDRSDVAQARVVYLPTFKWTFNNR